MRKLLIIEDDPDYLYSLEKNLSLNGYSLDKAENGKKAWELFQKQTYPVVITDLRMGDALNDGLLLLEKIKESSSLTQVIILTGNGSESDAIRSVNLHAFGYLKKAGTRLSEHLLKMIESAFLEFEKQGGVDWFNELENKDRSSITIEELNESLKSYPSLSDEVRRMRDED